MFIQRFITIGDLNLVVSRGERREFTVARIASIYLFRLFRPTTYSWKSKKRLILSLLLKV